MKKLSGVLLVCICVLIAGCPLLVKHAYDTQPISESRRTVITVGDAIQLRNLEFQNLSTTPGGNVTVAIDTLQPSVRFGTYSGLLRWDSAASKLQFSNDAGATWTNIGSGSGGRYSLYSPDHTNAFLTRSQTDFLFLNASTLQVSAFANFSSMDTAEAIVYSTESSYACTVFQFGKSAANRMIVRLGTLYDTSCVYDTYSSAILPASAAGQWHEFGALISDQDDIVALYVDGTVNRSYALSAMLLRPTVSVTTTIYDGWGGYGGPLKIGRQATWTTVEGETKPISTEGIFYPSKTLWFPFTEELATEQIEGGEWTQDADVTWEEVSLPW